ncbi:SLAP domain-containing protein [Companilactobacillus sp. HBUAS59544]|uniref:SLAP domain-containing protein n=1 Tax=Companilactobacillus sp. HBUAS59544 TaxID=3109363 RepID=UPI002FF2C323
MNKKKIVLASTLAILMAPSVLNNLSANQPVQAATTQLIGTVKRGGTQVVDANGKFVPGAILGNYTSWKLGPEISINGNNYYEVATNQYVAATALSISGGQPTTQTSQLIGTIRHGGTVAVDAKGNLLTNAVFGNYTSWKLGQRILINGNPYYQVATNEYINATAMDITQNGKLLNPVDSEISNVNETKTVGNTAASVVNANGVSLGITLPAGSSWHVDQTKIINSYPYYRVATNEWVKGLDFVIDSSTTTTTTPTTVLKTITLRTNSTIYNSQGSNTGSTLPAGSAWKVSQVKNINGHEFYQVATNEWILATEDKNTSIFAKGNPTITLSQNTQLYNTATNSMTRSLTAGTSWKISSSVENSAGYYFAQVSNNEWIPLGGSISKDSFIQEELANSAVYEPSFAISLFK